MISIDTSKRNFTFLSNILGSVEIHYPNLFRLEYDHNDEICAIYFKDKNISKHPLEVDEFNASGILLKNKDIYISLIHVYADGSLMLYENIQIPIESCIGLFDMGIRVSYTKDGAIYEYDQLLMRRNYTLDNIINHE